MAYCLVCKAEFWCRPIPVPSGTPKEEPPTYRVPPASSSSSAPPTVVAAQPELKLPEAPGVIWRVETHKGYSYVRPEKRLVTPVDGTGKQGTPGVFEYCGVRASGTYVTLNNTLVSNIGKTVLQSMKTKWPGEHVPDIKVFMKFLRSRVIGDNKSLADLFEDPVRSPDNWFRFGWKAFNADRLPTVTANENWKGYKSDWQTAWNKIGDALQNCDRWPTK